MAFPFAEKYAATGSCGSAFRPATTLSALSSAPARLVWVCGSAKSGSTSLLQRVVSSSDDLIQIDEADVLLLGYLSRPAAVVCGVPNDLAVLPCLAGNGRADDRDRPFGLGVRDVLAQVPAIGVHRLVDLEDWIVDLFGLVTDAMKRSASAGGIVERAVVVVAPLKENDVAGLYEGERLRPLILHDVRAAAAAADGAIVDVDLAGVEEIDQRLTPTPLTAGTVGVAVADGRVSDQKERWKLRVGRGFEPDLRVGGGIGRSTLP